MEILDRCGKLLRRLRSDERRGDRVPADTGKPTREGARTERDLQIFPPEPPGTVKRSAGEKEGSGRTETTKQRQRLRNVGLEIVVERQCHRDPLSASP